jgi:hypothetical protein
MADKEYEIIRKRVDSDKCDQGIGIDKQVKAIEKSEKLIWLGFDDAGYMVFRKR